MKNWIVRRKLYLGLGLGFTALVCLIGFVFLIRYRNELSLARQVLAQGEVTYLVLLQNSLELRPTGGFIGNFAEVTMRGGKLQNYTIYNTNVFDYGKRGIDSPQPFKDMLGIQEIQLRDGNWDPDFPTTAQNIINLYQAQGGSKDIQGVVAINSHILPKILELTGPISIASIETPLTKDNVLLEVQYELNFGFMDRGVSRAERKESISELAKQIETKIRQASWVELYQLARIGYSQLQDKQILVWSRDIKTQKTIQQLGWSGAIDETFNGDYLMLVDANLGALKTDYYMQRSIRKSVQECGQELCSQLEIIYHNTASQASKLNNDYKSYTRVLLPAKAFVTEVSNIQPRPVAVDYSLAYGKKVVGFEIAVPFNAKRSIILEYRMPKPKQYTFLFQKQSGVASVDFELDYLKGTRNEALSLSRDWQWKE